MNERCKHCGRTIVLWGGDGKLWVHKDDDHTFCSMDDDDNNDRAEPSREPEAAPEGVSIFHSDSEYHEYKEGYVAALGAGCGTCYERGIGLTPKSYKLHQSPASEAQAPEVPNAELAQLRARVAILDAQEAKLPELDQDVKDKWTALSPNARVGEVQDLFNAHKACRERQLLDALRAIQAWRACHKRLVETLDKTLAFIVSRHEYRCGQWSETDNIIGPARAALTEAAKLEGK